MACRLNEPQQFLCNIIDPSCWQATNMPRQQIIYVSIPCRCYSPRVGSHCLHLGPIDYTKILLLCIDIGALFAYVFGKENRRPGVTAHYLELSAFRAFFFLLFYLDLLPSSIFLRRQNTQEVVLSCGSCILLSELIGCCWTAALQLSRLSELNWLLCLLVGRHKTSFHFTENTTIIWLFYWKSPQRY